VLGAEGKGKTRVGQLTFYGESRKLISTEPEAYQIIAQLGKEGWELVSHSTMPLSNNGMANYYSFKRPIKD
jgi:hypothetical protein